ncbi:hypothetical protein ACFL4A_03720, partial [bacterium]
MFLKIRLSRIISALLLVSFVFNLGYAFEGKGGRNAMPFLLIDYSPRSSACGQLGTAVANDIAMSRYNPAGYSLIPTNTASFSHVTWLDEINGNYVGLALPKLLDGISFGANLVFLNDRFPYVDSSYNEQGDIEYENTLVHLGASVPFSNTIFG